MFDPKRGYPLVVPYVRYKDPAAAINWLVAVLGAQEAARVTLPAGRLGHAELRLGGQGIAIGLATSDVDVRPPQDRESVRAMTLVFVSDVDACTQRAVDIGGTLVDGPVDMPWGLRQSIVADPEAHVWELSTHQRDVPAAEWGAELTSEWFYR